MASITLPRPSRKGNLANVVKHNLSNTKGADKGQKKKKKGAVSTEASTWRDLEFGSSRLQGYGGLSGSKACTTTTYIDSKQLSSIREG